MSRITNPSWVICCALLLGWTANSTAGGSGVVGGDAFFISDQKCKAKDTPQLRVSLPIPPNITEGTDFRIECFVGAFRNHDFDGRRGVRGRFRFGVLILDTLANDFEIVELKKGRFKTDATGFSRIDSGTITYGAWATRTSEVITRDVTLPFTIDPDGSKKIVATNAGCELVPMDQE